MSCFKSEIRFIITSLNFNLELQYHDQDISLIAKAIDKFRKRNPNTPVGEGCWLVKYLIVKYLQHHREYKNRKDKNNKNKNTEESEKGKKKSIHFTL